MIKYLPNYTITTPTTNLKWKNGVLFQLHTIEVFEDFTKTIKEEWIEVPNEG